MDWRLSPKQIYAKIEIRYKCQEMEIELTNCNTGK